jgi:hypothetical protein
MLNKISWSQMLSEVDFLSGARCMLIGVMQV